MADYDKQKKLKTGMKAISSTMRGETDESALDNILSSVRGMFGNDNTATKQKEEQEDESALEAPKKKSRSKAIMESFKKGSK